MNIFQKISLKQKLFIRIKMKNINNLNLNELYELRDEKFKIYFNFLDLIINDVTIIDKIQKDKDKISNELEFIQLLIKKKLELLGYHYANFSNLKKIDIIDIKLEYNFHLLKLSKEENIFLDNIINVILKLNSQYDFNFKIEFEKLYSNFDDYYYEYSNQDLKSIYKNLKKTILEKESISKENIDELITLMIDN